MSNEIMRRRLITTVPLVALGAGSIGFYTMLNRMETGKFDPHDIGNPTVGKRLPDFSLPGFDGPGFTSAELVAEAAKNGPVVLNFFASWCIPCANEAPVMLALAKDNVRLWGISYKDHPTPLRSFFAQGGNPFARVGMDSGRTAIDFGLFGVPETFIVDRHGMIAWHLAGPLDADAVNQNLLPKLASL